MSYHKRNLALAILITCVDYQKHVLPTASAKQKNYVASSETCDLLRSLLYKIVHCAAASNTGYCVVRA